MYREPGRPTYVETPEISRFKTCKCKEEFTLKREVNHNNSIHTADGIFWQIGYTPLDVFCKWHAFMYYVGYTLKWSGLFLFLVSVGLLVMSPMYLAINNQKIWAWFLYLIPVIGFLIYLRRKSFYYEYERKE